MKDLVISTVLLNLQRSDSSSGPFLGNLERIEAALTEAVVNCKPWESTDSLFNSISAPGMLLITELMSKADKTTVWCCSNDEACVGKTESVIN